MCLETPPGSLDIAGPVLALVQVVVVGLGALVVAKAAAEVGHGLLGLSKVSQVGLGRRVYDVLP